MAKQPEKNADKPFDLAMSAAVDCVEQIALLHQAILRYGRDFESYLATEVAPTSSDNPELTEKPEDDAGSSKMDAWSFGLAKFATWLFTDLWTKLPQFKAQIGAVTIDLCAVRSNAIQGWQGVWFANAHEACLGMAEAWCRLLWQIATQHAPSILNQTTRIIVEQGLEDALLDWGPDIKAVAELPDPGQIRSALLAEARIEQAKVRTTARRAESITAAASSRDLQRLAAATPGRGGFVKKESLALAILMNHPEWTDIQIAKEVGVSRTTLYRWPKYQKSRAALRAGRQDMPRGRKDDGRLEAWDEPTREEDDESDEGWFENDGD
jgi:hypothetical protein